MAHDLVFKSGLIVTPTGVIQGGVAVDGERIAAVGGSADVGRAHREIDLDGRILFPGCFDPHVHFGIGDVVGDDTMLEDFRHTTRDCLVGGVTTIATTTLFTRDPLTELFDRALRCAERHAYCDYKITAVVNTPEQVRDIPAVVSRGGIDFKFFTGYVGEQAESVGINPEGITPDMFFSACEQISRWGPPAFAKIHAEDPYVRGILVDRLRRSGRTDYLSAWAESSPDWAESLQIYTYGLIAQHLRVPLYPVHISCGYTVETIKRLLGEGFNIVGETLAYFLCATAPEMDARAIGGKGKIQPPLRFDGDRRRLWQGIREGTIRLVGTDSLSYSAAYKESVDFWECRVGVNPQTADTLPLLFEEGVKGGRIDLATLAKMLSENAARMYGLYPRKGAIVVGADADLVVIDQHKKVRLGTSRYRSQADYSLWEGREVTGVPTMTFLRGQLAMEDGEVVALSPNGQFVPQISSRRGVG